MTRETPTSPSGTTHARLATGRVQEAPDGWVLVPRESTEEMWRAHWQALSLTAAEFRKWWESSLRHRGPHESVCVTAWHAMIDATPKPEESDNA